MVTRGVEAREGTPKEVLDHKIISTPFGFGAIMCLGARLAEAEMLTLYCSHGKITSIIIYF